MNMTQLLKLILRDLWMTRPGDNFGAALKCLLLLWVFVFVILATRIYISQTKSNDFIPVRDVRKGNGEFAFNCGPRTTEDDQDDLKGSCGFEMPEERLLRLARREFASDCGPRTTDDDQDDLKEFASNCGPRTTEDDQDDLKGSCSFEMPEERLLRLAMRDTSTSAPGEHTREPGPNKCIQEYGIADSSQQAKCSDCTLGSDEVDETKQGLLLGLLVLFALTLQISEGNMSMRLDTRDAPYSTMRCDPNYSHIEDDGTSQQHCFQGKQANSWKATLRSLEDPWLLAGSYSRLQQVGAVPFTQLDYDMFDLVEFIIILLIAMIVPIEETGDHADRFMSLRTSTPRSRRIIQNLLEINTDRCGGGRNGCQPDQTLANSVSAVGSVPGEVGAVGGTTPDHVKRATSADSKRLEPQVSTVAVHNLQVSLLEEETYRLRSQWDCVVCRCNARNVVFLPCGHLVCCQECSAKVVSCPICRADIDGRQDVHIPD